MKSHLHINAKLYGVRCRIPALVRWHIEDRAPVVDEVHISLGDDPEWYEADLDEDAHWQIDEQLWSEIYAADDMDAEIARDRIGI